MAFLRFFLSVGEIEQNWVEGSPPTPKHLSVLDVTLGDHRPTSEPPRSGALRDRKSFVRVTLGASDRAWTRN